VICKQMLGDANGNRLYNIIKILAKDYRDNKGSEFDVSPTGR